MELLVHEEIQSGNCNNAYGGSKHCYNVSNWKEKKA